MTSRSALAAFLLLLCHCGHAVCESPILAIDAIYPPAISVGTTSTLTVTAGRFTQDIEELRFSHPDISATVVHTAPLPFDDVPVVQYGSFSVHVSPDVPEGFYEVWGVGRYGISNPRTLAVVRGSVELLPANTDPKQPPVLLPGVCYVGRTRPNARLHFRLPDNLKQPRIVVAADSLDSKAIPVLSVQDEGQATLFQRRASASEILLMEPTDAPADCANLECHYTLHDFLYRGGEGFALAVMVDPVEGHFLTQPSPWCDPSTIARNSLVDWPKIASAPLGTIVPTQLPPPPWVIALELPVDNHQVSVEFPPVEGTAYECEVFAQSLRQTCDLRAIIDRPLLPQNPDLWPAIESAVSDGREESLDPNQRSILESLRARSRTLGQDLVAVVDDGPVAGTRAVRIASSDPVFLIPAGPTNKALRITLRDLLRSSASSPLHVEMRVGPPIPRFQAIAYWTPDTNNPAQAVTTGSGLVRGGQTSVHVSVRRAGGFQGPIECSLEGLPEGIQSQPAVVAAGQTETELILYAAENAAPWIGPLTVMARANIDDVQVEQAVHAASIGQGASVDRGFPQGRLSSRLMLRVIERDVAPIQIRAGDGNVIEVAQGAKVTIPVRAVRRTGGEAKCVLRPQNVPPKVTFKEWELAPDVLEANPEWSVAADAPLGEFSVWLQAEVTVKRSLHPEAHARLVAYRERLQSRLADPSWSGDRTALEKAVAELGPRIDASTKETTPRDFPTFFSVADFRVRIVPAPQPGQ